MYAKFHNDRLRNGWDITLWNFAKTRTNKQTNTHTNTQTNKQTNKQTDMGITIPRPPLWSVEKWLRYYTLKFCENTDKQTNKHTHKHTNKQTNRHGHYNTSPSPYGGEVIKPSTLTAKAIPIYKCCTFWLNKIIVDFYCYYMNVFIR